MKNRIQYHQRSKQLSIDKSNPEILTSSPIIDMRGGDSINKDIRLEDGDYLEEASFKNTIQSMNEKDNVNYLIESNQNELFKTSLKDKNQEVLFQDTDNNYDDASNKLIDTIKKSLEYFKYSNDITMRNEDKVPTVKILKEHYDKMKMDYENVVIDNQKLKEKIKVLRESSPRTNNITENVNISKFMDSLMYLQNKNEELEKENRYLKTENDDLVKKIKKKRYASYNEKSGSKSQSLINSQGRAKQDQMEGLLKEQISCMKKMLFIVQDDKQSPVPKKRIISHDNDHHGYDIESDSDSNIHFEESFNVTNLSNSGDYTPDMEIM